MPTHEERSPHEVAELLSSKVAAYHAQIGPCVKREALQALESNLLSEAKDLFHREQFEEALGRFTHGLSLVEKTRTAKDLTVRGAILHNIASCLHHLGQYDAAQEYYQQAIQAFTKCKTPLHERLLHGNMNQRRLDFVKSRLIDISWGRKPDNDKYLNEHARKRPVPQPPAGTKLGASLSSDSEWAAPRTEGGASNRFGLDYEVEDELADEQARKEWLQHYIQTENWERAAVLVMTPAEREDLEYLRGYQKRAAGQSQSSCPQLNGAGEGKAVSKTVNTAALARARASRNTMSAGTAPTAPPPRSDIELIVM